MKYIKHLYRSTDNSFGPTCPNILLVQTFICLIILHMSKYFRILSDLIIDAQRIDFIEFIINFSRFSAILFQCTLHRWFFPKQGLHFCVQSPGSLAQMAVQPFPYEEKIKWTHDGYDEGYRGKDRRERGRGWRRL